jgi:hypothetical protein
MITMGRLDEKASCANAGIVAMLANTTIINLQIIGGVVSRI